MRAKITIIFQTHGMGTPDQHNDWNNELLDKIADAWFYQNLQTTNILSSPSVLLLLNGSRTIPRRMPPGRPELTAHAFKQIRARPLASPVWSHYQHRMERHLFCGVLANGSATPWVQRCCRFFWRG